MGSIAPGRRADVILTSDLKTLPIEDVIARGQDSGAEAARSGQIVRIMIGLRSARQTVHMGKILVRSTLTMRPRAKTRVTCKVIGVVENQAPTKALQC